MPCTSCGLEWPFPHPNMVEREWICQVCVSAEIAKIKREIHDKMNVALEYHGEDFV